MSKVLTIVLNDDSIGAVIVVSTDLPSMTSDDTLACLNAVAQESRKPIIACLLGPLVRGDEECGVAVIPSPERAAIALAHVCDCAQWRDAIHPAPVASTVISNGVRDLIAQHLTTYGDGWMTLDDASTLLRAEGLPVAATTAAFSAEGAAKVAASLGFPVVMKVRSGSMVHKSDIGGVVVDLADEAAVALAYESMSDQIGEAMGGVVLQKMAQPGVEAIVGLTRDPSFGPMVMVGMGGVMTDLIGDHVFGIPPLGPIEAAAMVAALRTAPLLDGYRGAAPLDRGALVELVERVAHLADEIPELLEIDLNPVIVGVDGVMAVDCKVRLAHRSEGPGALFRALRAPK